MASIKSIEDVVQRAESLVARVQGVVNQRQHVELPELPLPLTVTGCEEWVVLSEECCRRPRIAESKRLFKEKLLDPAAVPSNVLSQPDKIATLFRRIEECPSAFHKTALSVLSSALTKGFDDAEVIASTFTTAATELRAIDDARAMHKRICDLAESEAAINPASTKSIVEKARRVCQLEEVVTKNQVRIPNFTDLDTAASLMGNFVHALQSYDHLVHAEGLSGDDRASIAGKCTNDAVSSLQDATQAILNEKAALGAEVASLRRDLELIGAQANGAGSTVAELRSHVADLKQALSSRRRDLQSSLGESVYHIVHAIVAGTIPPLAETSDADLGVAIRKAVECGYQLNLEPPREN